MDSEAYPAVLDVEWSFPQFTTLPKEIRLMIWREALPGPRIVFLERMFLLWYPCTRVWSDKEVDQYNEDGSPTFFDVQDGTDEMNELFTSSQAGLDYGPENQCCGFSSACVPPVLLYVCRESYEVTCQFYSRAFGTERALATTWFDFRRDTLYLDWNKLGGGASFYLTDLGILEPARVQNLALFDSLTTFWTGGLGHKDDTEYENYEHWICDVLRVFCNLKKLTIVVSQGHEDSQSGDLMFKKPEPFLGLIRFQISGFRDTGMSFSVALRSFRVFSSYSIEHFGDDTLDIYKNKLIEQGLPPWNTLPEIDYQIVTTPEIRTQLEIVETMFEELPPSQQHAILREDLTLHCITSDDAPEPKFEFSTHTFCQ